MVLLRFHHMTVKNVQLIRWATAVLAAFLLVVLTLPATVAFAQDTPVNLSQSGAAVEPLAWQGPDGTLHAVWQDRFTGFVYASGVGANWAEPTAITVPFTEPAFSTPANENFNNLYTPNLLLDGQGIIHAFWQVQGGLLYSNVPLAEFANGAAWSATQSVAASAPAYAVAVADDGRLHLAYIRTASTTEFPAGVYYRQRNNEGWTNARELYQSDYLRSATIDQLHVDIAAVGSERIIITWDNYLIDAVFYVRSSDAGATWPDPIALDQRGEEDSFDLPGPHYLQVVAHQNDVHLFWNRYSGLGRCALTHRQVADGGSSWQPVQTLFEGSVCPARRQTLVDQADGQLYLFTEAEQGGTAVRAWLGETWSTPQTRSGLLNFTNPETFRPVSIDCLQPIATGGSLYMIGCGGGTAQDIWLVRGSLPDMLPMAGSAVERWQSPIPVTVQGARQDYPVLLSGADGLLHALWLEQDADSALSHERIIRYAYWDGADWSRPAPIVEGNVDQITAVVSPNNRLLLVWRDRQQGALWFSQVELAQAAFPAQWSPPRELVSNETAVSHPELMVTDSNTLYMTYAVTLNEGRGIYLRRSDDGGFNWSESILVFDAAAANYSMVDDPHLTKTADGTLHLMWSRHDLLQGSQPIAYYYVQSSDQGETWSSDPVQVVSGSVAGGELIANPFGADLLRLWQESDEERAVVWYQYSENAGRTWTQAVLLPSLEDLPGHLTTLVDPIGRIHLLHLAANEDGIAQLDSWLWDGGNWRAGGEAGFEVSPAGNSGPGAAIDQDGTLMLLFAAVPLAEISQNTPGRLFYTTRSVELPEERPLPPPIVEEPTATPTPDDTDAPVDETVQVAATPTLDLAAIDSESAGRSQIGPIDTSTSTGRILAGVLPATLIVLLGVAFGLYALRKRDV
jgi:hypothetical protein